MAVVAGYTGRQTQGGALAESPCSKQEDFKSLVLSCNKDGMDCLRKGQLKAASDQLKYAEAILIAKQEAGECVSLLAVTCNNLGCYYRKTGKLHGALSYLRRALRIQEDLQTDEVTLAGTHLNICAILSKLEKHDKALEHAEAALHLMDGRVARAGNEQVSQDDYSVFVISYHNVAVECDFLGQYEDAAAAFQQGHSVAMHYLGENHALAATLRSHRDAVLEKSQRAAKKTSAAMSHGSRPILTDKPVPGTGTSQPPWTMERGDAAALPNLPPGSSDSAAVELDRVPQESVRQQAASWVASEEAAWANFARDTLQGSIGLGTRVGQARAPPYGAATLPSPVQKVAPRALDPIAPPHSANRMVGRQTFEPSTWKSPLLRKTPLAKTFDEFPDVIGDIIGADAATNAAIGARAAPSDCRPNRVMKGATRTAKVVRRTGMAQSTKHRDLLMAERTRGPLEDHRNAYKRQIAAERIQRTWRAWSAYCRENHDWMTVTWMAATIIQVRWRSYHRRRLKLDRGATCIQKHVRGYLVRRILRRHQAAVEIQRRVIGMLTRMQLWRLNLSAIKMQSLARGGGARRKVRNRRKLFNSKALNIQCAFRCFVARRVASHQREIRDDGRRQVRAAVSLQRLFRGYEGRLRSKDMLEKRFRQCQEQRAATMIQAMLRRKAALARTGRLRLRKRDERVFAATYIGKMMRGHRARIRYKLMLGEFARHEVHVVTMQRYARGFLIRIRMWKVAIRAEEELWAASELQRVWRGYKGRIRWEAKYEELWMRQMAAATLQRNIRGWLARTQVARLRRKIARMEFDKARRRFRSARKIQALMRGVLSRKISHKRNKMRLAAIVHIQRIQRGGLTRKKLWAQIVQLRAVAIQAAMRGFLVRRRRLQVIACTVCIQRQWRAWRNRPASFRQIKIEARRQRKVNAMVIQRSFRQHAESKQIERIHQSSSS
jgi:tetratricopeptide (TPR) repeat protein